MEKKRRVTLIGEILARPGLEFIYEGKPEECRDCRLKKACHNLEPGRKYRVVGVRNTASHDCPLHAGKAVAVEVEEAPVIALISAELAIPNSCITFRYLCHEKECRGYELCHPDGIIEGEKYLVGEVLGNNPDICLKNHSMKLVELRPV
ncbi:MAG: UPF0179 family protein [Methanoculleaceae archaeon]